MSEEEPTQIRRVARRGTDGAAGAADAPCVVVLTGRRVGSVHHLYPTGTVIGRGTDSEIMLDDDGVSRTHCMIFADERGWRIRDLGSTNGTFVGERTIEADPAPLHEGDRIRLGPDVILRFGTQDAIERQFLDHLYRSATRDALTGLANRRLLHDQLDSEVAWHRRHGQPMSVLFLDLDRFKAVNDRHGHVAGDAVLVGVAQVLMAEVRTEDLVARYGGEEFVVVLRQTPAEIARAIAERVRAAIARHPFAVGPVTVSIGVATATGDAIGAAESMVAAADTQLYRAKERGRNQVAS